MRPLFKLRHIPTGLFFKPTNKSGNLSQVGKIYGNYKYAIPETIRIRIYSTKKEPTGLHKRICSHFGLEWNNGYIDTLVKTNKEDWEVLKYIDGEFRRVQPEEVGAKNRQNA